MTFNAEAVAQGANLRGEPILETVIGQFAGYVSACWENLNDAGVFRSNEAGQAVDSVVSWLKDILHYGSNLEEDITRAINYHSWERFSGTPDFILAEYLTDCLASYEKAIQAKDEWHGKRSEIEVPK